MSGLQRKDRVIILRDFNARVGNKRGIWRSRGDWRVDPLKRYAMISEGGY